MRGRLISIDDEKLTTEVAVVGGGPAGLTAAIALAGAGVKTALIAAQTGGRDNRTTALFSSSVAALQAIGIWDACCAEAAPLKTLRICGAPRSKHARDFTLPEHLWGTKADEAFLTSRHNPDFYTYGEAEEIYVPFQQLPVHLRPKDVSTLPLNTLRILGK